MRPTSGSEPKLNPRNSGSYIGKRMVSATAFWTILSSTAAMPRRSCSPVRLRYLYPPRRTTPGTNSALNPGHAGRSAVRPVTLPVFMLRHADPRLPLPPSSTKSRPTSSASVVMWCNSAVELLLRLPRCCLPYGAPPLVSRAPGAVSACVHLASRIPLGSSPSLRRLRRNRGPFVRRPHRYYGQTPIAPTRSSSIRTISSLPRPRYDDRGGLEPSQVPCVDVRAVPGFL